MFKSFEHWSWSQLQTWRECPYRARLRYIEHAPEPPRAKDDPRDRGIALHKAAEDYLLKGMPLDPAFAPFAVQMAELKGLNPEVEQRNYFDRNWRPCDRDGRWAVYIPDVRVTVGNTTLTIDFKTGKKYGNEVKHFGQLQFYSVGHYCAHPEVENHIGEVWYIDQKDIVTHQFQHAALATAKVRLDDEVARMMADKVHAPRPNKVNCKYCPFGPRGTGACPVGV